MGTRRKSRELALQMLFQSDMGKQDAEQVRRTFWAEHGTASAEVRGFADDLFRVAIDRGTEIDGLIEKHAEHWRMERMAAVDRNLLRAAVAELMAYPETPRAVIINEALEIARKFSSPESVHFVNGVLDSVGKELGGDTEVPLPFKLCFLLLPSDEMFRRQFLKYPDNQATWGAPAFSLTKTFQSRLMTFFVPRVRGSKSELPRPRSCTKEYSEQTLLAYGSKV